MSSSSPIEIQKYLSGVDYPADRDKLIEAAESNGADSNMLELLRGISDRTSKGPSGVSKGLSGQS